MRQLPGLILSPLTTLICKLINATKTKWTHGKAWRKGVSESTLRLNIVLRGSQIAQRLKENFYFSGDMLAQTDTPTKRWCIQVPSNIFQENSKRRIPELLPFNFFTRLMMKSKSSLVHIVYFAIYYIIQIKLILSIQHVALKTHRQQQRN